MACNAARAMRRWARARILDGMRAVIVKLLLLTGAATFVTKRMGGSCTQVGKPGQKEPGRPEDLPRTAAITRNCGHKKSACSCEDGRCCAFCMSGYQARSLNLQRRAKPTLLSPDKSRHVAIRSREGGTVRAHGEMKCPGIVSLAELPKDLVTAAEWAGPGHRSPDAAGCKSPGVESCPSRNPAIWRIDAKY